MPDAAARQPARAAGAVESWTVTAGEIDAWLKVARTGETFIYAHGPQLVHGAAAARVTELAKREEVAPHQVRTSDGGFDFIIRRNRIRSEVRRAAVCDAMMMAVLVELQDAAQNHVRCPSDGAIGEAADLSPGQVKHAMRKLEGAGFIASRIVATAQTPRFRIVKVVATGAETRGPE